MNWNWGRRLTEYRQLLRAILGVAMLLFGVAVQAAQIDGVRIWRSPDSTRLVFDLSASVDHRLFTLDSPRRVVIDINKAELGRNLPELALANTPVSAVRYGRRDDGGLRVVLDLKQEVTPSSFVLPRHGDMADRLVIDLHDKQSRPTAPVASQALADLVPERRDIIIAVDPGHGGEDPGAVGPGRIMEKHVVMAISRKLVDMINREPGYTAYLVRTGDYYVPLRDRRNRARSMRADLFVSIHADAFHDPRANGASVFALSRSGATSESARFLAQKENEADLIGGVGGVSLMDVDNVLAGVLVDLSMTATLSSSLQVGERVLREMGKVARLHKPQVEQAGFAVLKSPDVPSILVETGFISNPQEAQKLNTQSYRRFMAEAIFNGIRGYFYDAPPPGTLVAWQKNNGGERHREYVIARGDTLSTIAQRHNVSLSDLLQRNGLDRTSVIRVGQKLVIPAS